MGDSRADFSEVIQKLELSDRELVTALDARASAIKRLRELNEQEPEAYFKLPQDHEVLARAREVAESFPPDGVEAVMREVLSTSAQMIAPHEVSYVGPEGSLAQVAARAYFGSATGLRSSLSIADVFEEVSKKRSAYGVVPLESSSDGAVTGTLNGLVQSEVMICGEQTVAARYHLIALHTRSAEIKTIFGAPHAVLACERFLRVTYPAATVRDVASGEVAIEEARKQETAAAVTTELRAELDGLHIVHERIEDSAGAEARFAIVGTSPRARSGNDRTVLAMAARDEPGALYRVLQPFGDRGINLMRLESRPSPETSSKFVFFVELRGHITDRTVTTAVEEVRGMANMVKVLGSYPEP